MLRQETCWPPVARLDFSTRLLTVLCRLVYWSLGLLTAAVDRCRRLMSRVCSRGECVNYTSDTDTEEPTGPRTTLAGPQRTRQWFMSSMAATTSDESDDDSPERTRCCICYDDLESEVTKKTLLPCNHDGLAHTNCVWDWVCCHTSGDPDSGFYYISCPVCRETKTVQLVSHADSDYGSGIIGHRRSLR